MKYFYILLIAVAIVTTIVQIRLLLKKQRENFESEPSVNLNYNFVGGSVGHFRLGTFMFQWGIQYFSGGNIRFHIPFTQFFGIQCFRIGGEEDNGAEFNIQPQKFDEKSVTMRDNNSVVPYCWLAYGLKVD